MEYLNFIKDIGITTATLMVLGHIMLKLVQAFIEYFRGVREDNQARNSHVGLLLVTNQSIASQMELTRKAIEQSAQVNTLQDQAIRITSDKVSTLHQDVQHGFTQVSQQVQPLLEGLATLVKDMETLTTSLHQDNAQLRTHLSTSTQQMVDDIHGKLDDTQGAIARALAQQLLPIITKLDSLTDQINHTRQDIVAAVSRVVPDIQAGTDTAVQAD